MRYEITDRFTRTPESPRVSIADGTPLNVTIHPEGTDVRKLFVAMVQSAYEMGDFLGLGSIEEGSAPERLSNKEALSRIFYDSKRTLADRLLMKPDTRVPQAVSADTMHGKALKLQVGASFVVPGAYSMNAYAFESYVGPVDELFRKTQEKLN